MPKTFVEYPGFAAFWGAVVTLVQHCKLQQQLVFFEGKDSVWSLYLVWGSVGCLGYVEKFHFSKDR